MKPTTPVVFRKWKDNGDVFALFPDRNADLDNANLCLSYGRDGHGGADYIGCIQRSVPAKRFEYSYLFSYLRKIGYAGLKSYRRAQPRFHNERRRAVEEAWHQIYEDREKKLKDKRRKQLQRDVFGMDEDGKRR